MKNNNDKKSFVGMGHNPEPGVPDIPLGLGMALMQNADARKNFEDMSNTAKTKVIGYIQGSKTGTEAKQRINSAVDNLGCNNTSFF